MTASDFRLGIDFGTSTTAAILSGPDGRWGSLLFDASPLLPSAVAAGPGGTLLTGMDAQRAAVAHPASYEASPKRRLHDGSVWLADREVPVVDLVDAILGRVAEEARRVAGGVPGSVVLTHPASWGRTRLTLLAHAARQAGLGSVAFVAEPVAAAAYFGTVLGGPVTSDRPLVVFDLGAGTFDVAVLRPGADGMVVAGSGGLADAGGIDLDALVIDHARRLTLPIGADAWRRLDQPAGMADRRARYELWRDARAAKEQLSRHPTAEIHLPLIDTVLPMTREEFEAAARPMLERTAQLTAQLMRDCAVRPDAVAGIFLVGGASRVPLAATLLHRATGVAPTVIDQPEIVVAAGSLYAPPAAPAHAALPTTPSSTAPPRTAPSPPAVLLVPGRSRTRVIATVATLVATLLAVTLALLAWQSRSPGRTAHLQPTSGPSPSAADAPTLGAAFTGTLTGHTDQIWRLAFSPDSTTLASSSHDGTVRLWDVRRRQEIGPPLTGPRGPVHDLAFSPDGTTLATVSYDSTLRLWNVTDQQPIGAPIDTQGTYFFVTFSPDGRSIVASNNGGVQVWDVATRQIRGPPVTALPTTATGKIAFLPDGKTLAVSITGEQISLWDLASRQPVGPPPSPRPKGPYPVEMFSPDGATIAVADRGNDTRLWDVATHRLITTLPDSTAHLNVESLALSTHSRTLAIADDHATLHLWDTALGTPIGDPLTGHTNIFESMVFSPDGRYLATGSYDHTIRIYTLVH